MGIAANRIEVQVKEVNYPDDSHLSTFTQNIRKLAELISSANVEFSKDEPNDKRLEVFRSDIVSLTGELNSQCERAVAANGLDDPNVKALQSLMMNEMMVVQAKSVSRVAMLEWKLAALKEKYEADMAALELGVVPSLADDGPPIGPVDNTQAGGDDDGMLKRIEKLEADVAAIKIDVAVIKASAATKADIAELKGAIGELRASAKGDVADAKTAIIIWVVSAIFIAQLLPSLIKMLS